MPIDRAAARDFIWSTARLLDRHRYAMLFADGPTEPVLETLRGYRNPDGGFGHALEPDLRCPSSQPVPTLYALEILNEAGAADDGLAHAARAWVASIAAPDGTLPSVLPGFEAYPHAPWFAPGQGSVVTFGFAAAFYAAGVSGDDWLARATDWCWDAIATKQEPRGYWLKYACSFLDAVPDEDRARAAVGSLTERMGPSAGAIAGYAEGEALRPLDLSPRPGARSRGLVTDAEVEAHLDAVESQQQPDGGWKFDWLAWSPAQTNDWRGNVTIRALTWLQDNGRRDLAP